jgi:Flp pilus assembly secretin CpaC
MTRVDRFCIALLLVFSAAGYLGAQDEPEYLAPVSNRGVLQAKVGRGSLATLPAEVERIAIADEDIARAQVISAREVLFTGLRAGRTTVFVWLTDGRRFRYLLQIDRDLDLLRQTLRDLDSRIAVESSPNGTAIILRGEVDNVQASREAIARTQRLLGAVGSAEILDLLRYPGSFETRDDWLAAALHAVDPRIEARRIQVGHLPDEAKDSYILEGRVKTVQDLVRAMALAERQLGGTGVSIKAPDDKQLSFARTSGFIGGGGGGGRGGGGSGNALSGTTPPQGGLSAQVARGLLLTTESGRVLSLLEVDEQPQIMVSIKVMEIDRQKAKSVGINYRFDQDDFSIGSYNGPQGNLPGLLGQAPSVTGVGGNIAAAFVDSTKAIVAAIDFLENKALARAVAEPNILTLSGEVATVLVGGEVPIPTTASNQVSTFSGFFFQKFGVRLDIRPTIDRTSMVALEVSPSIIRPSPGLGNSEVPGFTVQTVQTTARVQVNQSLVIGGLLSFEEGLDESGIPGLRKIPIGLFSWKRKTRGERELLFVITPRLVITEPTEIVEPIEQPDFNTVELPELDWAKERGRWRNDFDPSQLRQDGVPQTFVPSEDEGYQYEFYENGTETDSEGTDETGSAETYYQPVDDTAEDAMEMEESAGTATDTATESAADSDVWKSDADLFPQTRIVSADPCLNLRPNPGVFDSPKDCLPMGTVVTVLEHQGVWGRVELQDGREGWMALSYLITREQLNDASTTIDTGAGKLTTDEFAALLQQRVRDAVGFSVPVESAAQMVDRAIFTETSQSTLETQLRELQTGIARVQNRSGMTTSN